MRHSALEVAVDEHLLDAVQPGQQLVVQHADPLLLGAHLGQRDREGLAHADALVSGQRARSHAALVAAAVHLGFEPHAGFAPHVQRAHALGAVGLVGRHAQQVDRQFGHVDSDLASGLRGVDVKDNAALAAQLADRDDVLDHPDLVVHKQHRCQHRVGPQRVLELIEVDQTVVLHVQVSGLESLALQLTHAVERGLVLGLERDDVLAAALVELRRALEREIDRLGRAAGPDNLARVGIDQCGHLLARFLDDGLGLPTPGMAARGRIAEMLAQPGDHGVDNAGVYRRGCAVIEVNREMRGHDEGVVVLEKIAA